MTIALEYRIDVKRFIKNLEGQFRVMRQAAFIALDRSAKDLYMKEMKKRIKSSNPGGRTYWFRTEAGRKEEKMALVFWKTEFGTYVTSEEGGPPRSLSGHLLDSFKAKTKFSGGQTRITAYIGNTAPYAAYLEYGSPVGGGAGPWPRGYMAPRPFMEPVVYDPVVNRKMLMRVKRLMKYAGQRFGAL